MRERICRISLRERDERAAEREMEKAKLAQQREID